jgi:serine protease Do
MTYPGRRIFSTIAIIIASVAFGVLITADLGFIRKSNAQSGPIQTTQGTVTSVAIPSFADVAARVAPAVVSITTTEIIKGSTEGRRRGATIDPFEFFFPDPQNQPNQPNQPRRRGQVQPQNPDDEDQKQLSGGSGFIISPDGYILTNNHVVDNASKVEVHFGADDNGEGGRSVIAKIIGRDPSTDLALLKIDVPDRLPTVALGDSDHIRKGDWAIAIGNPFQFENTLTVGVISAKGRALGLSAETRSFENFIQTDAAINFGNSGGPLLNINGDVIGINTAIRGGGAQNLGFATPINTAKNLLTQLKNGKVVRSYLGMKIGEITDDVQKGFNLPSNRGAVVQDVEAGKPAARAGIQHGDVIVQVNDHEVRHNRDLIDYISAQPVGSTLKVVVLRDGEKKTLSATTAERQAEGEREQETPGSSPSPSRNKLGVIPQELTPLLRQQYSIDESVHGVVVTNVKAVSAAADAGLSEGDVITEVNGKKVASVDEFRAAIEGTHAGQYIRLYVTTPGGRSGGAVSRFAIVQIP